MGGGAERKVYRASFVAIAPAWVGSVGFFVVGLSMVTIGPGQHGGVGSVVLGTVALLFSVWMSAVLATNRLIVTPGGLVHWNYLRRRSVGWAEVQSFGVGSSRSQMRWPGLVIRRNDGSVLVTNVVAFTRRYPARFADELAAWQRQLAHAALPGPFGLVITPGSAAPAGGDPVNGRVELRVYRPQRRSVAGTYVGAVGFFLAGLVMVASPRQVDMSGVAAGTAALLVSLWHGALLATNRLIVTPDGLVYWNNLRRRFIGWSSIRSFEVGGAPSRASWSRLVIRLDQEPVRVACVVGTRRFVARVADELRDLQRQHAPMLGDVLVDAVAADQPGLDDLTGVTAVGPGTGRADRGAGVLCPAGFRAG